MIVGSAAGQLTWLTGILNVDQPDRSCAMLTGFRDWRDAHGDPTSIGTHFGGFRNWEVSEYLWRQYGHGLSFPSGTVVAQCSIVAFRRAPQPSMWDNTSDIRPSPEEADSTEYLLHVRVSCDHWKCDSSGETIPYNSPLLTSGSPRTSLTSSWPCSCVLSIRTSLAGIGEAMVISLFQSGSCWLFEDLAGILRTYQVCDAETRADDTYRLSEPTSLPIDGKSARIRTSPDADRRE
jgi:hypothetical protein